MIARWTIRRDIQTIVRINKSYADPWNEDDIISHLRNANNIGLTLEYHSKIIGWLTYGACPDKFNLFKFMIEESHLRQGFGTFLLSNLINRLSKQRRTSITTEVCERNVRSQLFLQKNGFIALSYGNMINMEHTIEL